jgi:hypothetical protein
MLHSDKMASARRKEHGDLENTTDGGRARLFFNQFAQADYLVPGVRLIFTLGFRPNRKPGKASIRIPTRWASAPRKVSGKHDWPTAGACLHCLVFNQTYGKRTKVHA